MQMRLLSGLPERIQPFLDVESDRGAPTPRCLTPHPGERGDAHAVKRVAVCAALCGFDAATNAGVLAGLDLFTRDIFSVSAEGELTTTVADGDVSAGQASGSWDIDTRALYLAFRLEQRFYLKVRFGAAWTDSSAKLEGRSVHDSDSSLSWGGALGWKATERWGIQLDGSMVDTDTTYWNAGLVYHF
jgi:hypothetical protein